VDDLIAETAGDDIAKLKQFGYSRGVDLSGIVKALRFHMIDPFS
jgi:hypothetical protein